jgi:hypothetical protein
MDEAERKIAEQNLIEADDAIAQGREDISKQTQLIAELTRAGYDIQAATELLNILQETQRLRVEHRYQLRRELGLGNVNEFPRHADGPRYQVAARARGIKRKAKGPITTLSDMALCGGLRIRLYSRFFLGFVCCY